MKPLCRSTNANECRWSWTIQSQLPLRLIYTFLDCPTGRRRWRAVPASALGPDGKLPLHPRPNRPFAISLQFENKGSHYFMADPGRGPMLLALATDGIHSGPGSPKVSICARTPEIITLTSTRNMG